MFSSKQLTPAQTMQWIWAIALIAMGVAFFFRISVVMRNVADIETLATAALLIRLTLYLVSIILIGGGVKKIYGLLYPAGPDSDSE